jgi:hypothetical protein
MEVVGNRSAAELTVGEGQSHAVDVALARWILADETLVWEDEALMTGGLVEKHVLAVDYNRETVRLLRSWVPFSLNEALSVAISDSADPSQSKPAQVSVDLDKTFEQMMCDPDDIDEMSFPHADMPLGKLGEYHEGLFLDEFGGDVKFLWKSDQINRTAFLGRVARVGKEEALFGASITHDAGNPQIKIGFEIPMSDLTPTRKMGYR